MSLSLSPSSKVLARRAGSDWIVGGLGVGCAALSAGFAAYMIVVGPGDPDPRGSGYFTVFAHFDRRPQYAALHLERDTPAAAEVAPDRADRPAAPIQVAATSRRIDYTPTGSIADGGAAAPPSGNGPVLTDFVLRDVFDGKALVEGRRALRLVSPGMVLDGAGQVLSIERKGNAWVVVTKDGVIAGRAR